MASHSIDVYGAWLHVASTRKQWADLRRRFDALDETPDAMGLTYLVVDEPPPHTPHLAVWVDVKALGGSALLEIVTHESVHAAAQLLDHIGQQADRHDSEALAYLAGWAAARIWEAVA